MTLFRYQLYLLFATLICAAAPVSGQDTPSAVFDNQASLTPPRLIHYVDATPANDVRLATPVAVKARLDINAEGRVDAVRILNDVNDRVGEAARDAMMLFRFVPATRDGEPVACQVNYDYLFAPNTVAQKTEDASVADVPASVMEINDDGAGKEPAPVESEVYETLVRDERVRPEASKRTISSQEIQKIPGTHGDAALAIQSLPGVAKPPALVGALIVRGSSAHDSISLVDGLYTPSVFHFSAINAIVNSDLIDAVTFYPGNFSARYGRGTGGVVDVGTRAPKTDRLHAYLDVDLWDGTAFVEGPIGPKWSAAVSFRRSYIDGILRATGFLENQLRFTVAPRYYDFQILADYHPKGRDTLRLVFLGADDKVQFGSGILDESINLGALLTTRTYLYQVGAHWSHEFSSNIRNTLSLGAGVFEKNSEVSVLDRRQRGLPVHLRDELRIDFGETMVLSLGIDSAAGSLRTVDKDTTRQWSEEVDSRWTEGHPGLFAELELLVFDPVKLMYGIRWDYDTTVGRWTIDPRVSARYTPMPWTTLKAGFGLFHQTPSMFTQVVTQDNGDVKPADAIHYSFGVEQSLPMYRHLVLAIEGFYKDIRHSLAISPTWGTYSMGLPGRSLGLEVMLTHHLCHGFFGWISYTLMKSERYIDWEDTPRPFDYDQTHVLTVVAGIELPWQIDVGARFRLASGFPYTPIVGIRFIDNMITGYNEISGPTNSSRMPTFHQLDIRIDKTWRRRYLEIRVYLDIQNIYNRQNEVFYIYNDSYTKKKAVYDLPILPSIGLKVTY